MRRSVSSYRTRDGVADPSPDVGTWRRSLRALDPDARKKLSYSGDLFKSRDFSESQKTADLSATAALEREYIKSLQQQIYLLELENGHLRSKPSDQTLGSQKALEANERLLLELKALEAKIDALQADSARKDAAADQLQRRVIYLTSRLADREDAAAVQRDNAAVEAVEAVEAEELLLRRQERDDLRLRIARLRRRVQELEGLDGEARLTDNRARSLQAQLDAALSKLAVTGAAVNSERAAVTRLEAEVRRLERQLVSSAEVVDETATLTAAARRLRDENRRLRRLARADFATVARPEDLAALASRNAALEAAVRRLEAELMSRTSAGSVTADEAMRLREREKQLEQQADVTAREASRLRSRLAQLEVDGTAAGGVADVARQCRQLQRDNAQLARQVRSLEAALERKRAEKATASAAVENSEIRLSQLQAELSKLQELQASRWSEVEKIATTIKSAARSNSDLLEHH